MSVLERSTTAVVLLLSMSAGVSAQTAPGGAGSQDPAAMRLEIEQLRQELDTLKGQYESRLAALEAKLAQPAEQAAGTPAPPPPAPPQAPAMPDQPGVQPACAQCLSEFIG